MRLVWLGVFIILIGSFSAAEITSEVKKSCTGSQSLISISNESSENSHPAEPGYYQKQICVDGVEHNFKIDSSCEKNTGFYLSGRENNSHLSTYNRYDLRVCTGNMNIALKQRCNNNETAIFSASGTDDAHVSTPGFFNLNACASLSEPENVSITAEFNLSSSDKVYFDDNEIENEGNLFPPAEFPYLVSRSGEQMGGIITSDFIKASREIEGKNKLKIVKSGSKGSFMIPFTNADITDLEEREKLIKDKNFLNRIRSNFGFYMPEMPTIRSRYDPEINISSSLDLPPGSYSLRITKTGENEVGIIVE